MHSVTADQSVVRCTVKAKYRDRVKTTMRRLATAGCVFYLETTGKCPGTTVYRCEGYKSPPQCVSQEIVGQKKNKKKTSGSKLQRLRQTDKNIES